MSGKIGERRPPAQARNRSLDAFRAIFIASVIVFHYFVRWAPPENPTDLYGYSSVYSPDLELGRFGVHAFFMISGLFVATTLFRAKDAIVFAYRRFYRIYPAFLIAACCTFLVLSTSAPAEFKVDAKDFLLTLTLIPNHLGGRAVDGAYWSLAVEATFYVWTAIAWWLLRERFWLGMIGLAIASVVVQPILPKLSKEVLIGPYLAFFLAGIGLAYHAFLDGRRQALALYAAAAFVYAANWGFVAMHDGRVLLPNLVLLAAMAAVAVVTLRGWRIDIGPLPYFGMISYEIYLLHQKLGVIAIGELKRRLGLPDMLAAAIAVLAIVALAALLHHALQRPVQAAFRMGWERIERSYRSGERAREA